jgi:hypothetical protein
MIVVEALAAGTPVLASDVGGIPELLDYGSAGWLTKAGDVDAWRRSLQNLRNSVDIDTKSRAARDIYLKRHTPQEGLQSLVGSYESLGHVRRHVFDACPERDDQLPEGSMTMHRRSSVRRMRETAPTD